jgi:hypothetical protein
MKKYEFKSYPGLGHTVSPTVLSDVISFLNRVVPLAPDLVIKPKAPSEMTVKELKTAIRHAGLTSKAVGFMEKAEFVALLTEHYSKKI